jgi:hypothetical protein
MAILAASACTPDCPFDSRCEGDTLVRCLPPPHIDIGANGFSETPCEGANPVCVELGDDTADCFHSAQPCDPSTPVGRCDDDVLHSCDPRGFQTGVDCAQHGNRCEPSLARCAFAGPQACEQGQSRCDGDVQLRCQEGTHLVAFDCTTIFDPPARCVVTDAGTRCIHP